MARLDELQIYTPEWFREIEKPLRIIQDIVAPYEALKRSCISGMGSVLDSTLMHEASIIRQTFNADFFTTMKSALNGWGENLRQSTIPDSQLSSWAATVFDRSSLLVAPSIQLWNDVLVDLSSAALRIADLDLEITEEPVAVQELSENEKKRIAAEVTDILSDEKNWEQRLSERIDGFTKEHPVWAYIIKSIFIALILGIIQDTASTYIGRLINSAHVYEEPSSMSQTIYHIEQHQDILIINTVPYYYQIEIKDPSSEQVISGYVSKRSVQLQATEEISAAELNKKTHE